MKRTDTHTDRQIDTAQVQGLSCAFAAKNMIAGLKRKFYYRVLLMLVEFNIFKVFEIFS